MCEGEINSCTAIGASFCGSYSPPLTTVRAPNSRALRSVADSSSAGGNKMDRTKTAKPKIAVKYPCHKLNGSTTNAAPKQPSAMRNRVHDCSFRYRFRILGELWMAMNSAAPQAPLMRCSRFSCSTEMTLGVVLIRLYQGSYFTSE